MINNPQAVQPYVDGLLPVLRKVLIDPIPGVRSTSAKAFGTLTRGLGKGLPQFESLMQWLVATNRASAPASSVERSGAAQGFVEILVALLDRGEAAEDDDEARPYTGHTLSHSDDLKLNKWVLSTNKMRAEP